MAKAFVRGEEKRLPAGLRQAIACALLALLLIFFTIQTPKYKRR